ncbi:hypothetical protein AAG570_002076 [Ranatra chinensis]|uniref:CCHC-type domain-containing protein n=1 Tax=Ranatra chinensis TaxID=642074 RepID=A0ABD0YAE9_9HEMI
MSSRRVHNQRGLNSRPPLKGATAVHSSANQKGNSPAGLLNKGMAVLRKIQQRQDNVQPPTAQPPATRGAGKPASVDLGVSKTKNQTSFKKGVQKSETLKVAAANRLARRSAQSGSGRNLTVVGQGISGKAISEKTTSGKGNSDKTTSGKTMSRKAISEKANSRKAMPASRRSNQPQQVSSRIPRRAGKSLHLEGAAVHSEAAPGSSKIPSVRAAPSKRLKAVSKVSNRKTRPPSSTSKTSGPPKQPPTTPEEPRKQVVDPPPLKREEVLVPPVPQPPPDINQQDVGPKPPEPVKLPDLKTGATIVPVTPVGQIDSPVNKLTVIQRNLMESLSNPVFKSVRRPPTGLKEEEVTKPAFRPDHNSHRPVAAVAAVAAAKALDTSHTSHVVPKKPDPDGPFLDYRHFRSIVPKHLYYALEQRVLAALSAQKTFAVIGGRNYGIEVALRKRGWVQKFAGMAISIKSWTRDARRVRSGAVEVKRAVSTLQDVTAAASTTAANTVVSLDSVKTEISMITEVIKGIPMFDGTTLGRGALEKFIQYDDKESVIRRQGRRRHHLPDRNSAHREETEGPACWNSAPGCQGGSPVLRIRKEGDETPQHFAHRMDAGLRALKVRAVEEWGAAHAASRIQCYTEVVREAMVMEMPEKVHRKLCVTPPSYKKAVLVAIDQTSAPDIARMGECGAWEALTRTSHPSTSTREVRTSAGSDMKTDASSGTGNQGLVKRKLCWTCGSARHLSWACPRRQHTYEAEDGNAAEGVCVRIGQRPGHG